MAQAEVLKAETDRVYFAVVATAALVAAGVAVAMTRAGWTWLVPQSSVGDFADFVLTFAIPGWIAGTIARRHPLAAALAATSIYLVAYAAMDYQQSSHQGAMPWGAPGKDMGAALAASAGMVLILAVMGGFFACLFAVGSYAAHFAYRVRGGVVCGSLALALAYAGACVYPALAMAQETDRFVATHQQVMTQLAAQHIQAAPQNALSWQCEPDRTRHDTVLCRTEWQGQTGITGPGKCKATVRLAPRTAEADIPAERNYMLVFEFATATPWQPRSKEDVVAVASALGITMPDPSARPRQRWIEGPERSWYTDWNTPEGVECSLRCDPPGLFALDMRTTEFAHYGEED